MASQPVLPLIAVDVRDSSEGQEPERLTREQGWDLIVRLFGTAKEMYAEVGGSDAFMRAERDAWGG